MSQSEAGRRLDERYAAGQVSEDEYTRFRDRLRQAEAATAAPLPPKPAPTREFGLFEHMRRGEIGRYKGRLAFSAVVLVVVIVALNLVMPSSPSSTQSLSKGSIETAQPAPASPPTPGPNGYSDADLNRFVAWVNKDAPNMLSADRRFDHMTRMGPIFIYNYTDRFERSVETKAAYAEGQRQQFAQRWCADQMLRPVLFSVEYVAFQFFKESRMIMSFHISRSDCG